MNIGLAVGVIWLLVRLGGATGVRPYWVYKWFRAPSVGGEARFLSRVRTALSQQLGQPEWQLLWPLVVIAFAWLFVHMFDIREFQGFVSGVLISYTGASILGLGLGVTRRAKEQTAIYAAQQVAKRLSTKLAEEILVPLARSPYDRLRNAAVAGLRELGTPLALETLEKLKQDNSLAIAQSAIAASNDLAAVHQGNILPKPVGIMERYRVEYGNLLEKVGRRKRKPQHKVDLARMEEIIPIMDDIVFSQIPLRHAFPHVYCKNCYAWAEPCEFESWEWVRCHQCKEAAGLVAGVEHVIGQVGGVAEWALEEGILRVNLWDDVHRKARIADLDELEIVGGSTINYDWAVNAVLDKLDNHGQPAGKRPKVKLSQGAVLEANTVQLLRLLDAGVDVGTGR